MPTAILDTNVLVSSILLAYGVSGQVYQAWRERRFLLVSSQTQIKELARTLSYPRIRRRYPITDIVVDSLIATLVNDAVLLPAAAPVDAPALRDPGDSFLLSMAKESNADFLVSGDQDLLVLEKFGRTRIISPRNFLDLIIEGQGTVS